MRDKLGRFIKGHSVPTKWREGVGLRSSGNTYRRGSKHTKEAKEKNRLAHLGKITMSGSNHYNWRGGHYPTKKKTIF